ncbi:MULTISPECIES: hypothetical protein [unclassified Mesorhizobium]|uniref:hypothetical protein n=1 Tax=unclassified Mesorhizobium TaxID=325217 RepID=UPI0013E366B1|nr:MULTISPECIES: hypothetical protein [unclassified Mesorhizobium]
MRSSIPVEELCQIEELGQIEELCQIEELGQIEELCQIEDWGRYRPIPAAWET